MSGYKRLSLKCIISLTPICLIDFVLCYLMKHLVCTCKRVLDKTYVKNVPLFSIYDGSTYFSQDSFWIVYAEIFSKVKIWQHTSSLPSVSKLENSLHCILFLNTETQTNVSCNCCIHWYCNYLCTVYINHCFKPCHK